MSLRSLRLLRTAVLAVLALSLAGFLLRELTAEVDRLRSDPEFIEQMARERLGLVKPGDRVYKLPPSPGPAGATGQGSR